MHTPHTTDTISCYVIQPMQSGGKNSLIPPAVVAVLQLLNIIGISVGNEL